MIPRTILLLLLCLLGLTQISLAQKIYYSQTIAGDWSDITTWNTSPIGAGTVGIPGPLDQVFIQSTHTITIDASALTVSDLHIKGILIVDPLLSASLTVKRNLTIEAGGILNATGINEINIGGDWEKQVGGSFIDALNTVTFEANTDQQLIGENIFHNLSKTGEGSLILTGNSTILGDLTLTDGVIHTSHTNLLTIGVAGKIWGGSASSYVEGPLVHLLSVSEVKGFSPKQLLTRKFPFGSLGQYRPVTLEVGLSGAVSTVRYRGELHEQAPPDRTLPAGIDHISQQRYYTINQTLESALPIDVEARVIIDYNEDDGVDMPTELRVIKSDGPNQWVNINGQGAGTYLGGNVSSGIFTSFSDFALASSSSNNPLPVTLLTFEAQVLSQHIQLHWTTLTETDNSHFVIERSADGRRFEEIGTVAGAGNTYQQQTYRFADRHPLAGTQYYRLKQVDFDDGSTYFDIIAAQMTVQEVQLSPNPAQKQVTISGWEIGETVTIQVINASGRAVHQQRIVSNAAITILVDQYPAGIYQVVIAADNWRIQKKLVIH